MTAGFNALSSHSNACAGVTEMDQQVMRSGKNNPVTFAPPLEYPACWLAPSQYNR